MTTIYLPIENYKTLFEGHNPYQYECLKKENKLEEFFQNKAFELENYMSEIDYCAAFEQSYEANKAITGTMIEQSETQIFSDQLALLIERNSGEIDQEALTVLSELQSEADLAIVDSFPWCEVKLFAERLRPFEADISELDWQLEFQSYILDRIGDKDFKSSYQNYFN